MSLYVDHTGEPQVDHTCDPLPHWCYARIPVEVMCDPGLKPLDIRVYGSLSGSVWQGNTAKIGTRLIAKCIHASRRLVVQSLLRLEDRGHVERPPVRRGQREVFILTSVWLLAPVVVSNLFPDLSGLPANRQVPITTASKWNELNLNRIPKIPPETSIS
jgi:hypothetical protein